MGIISTDIELIIEKEELFRGFDNSSFLVTGATGLIGSVLVKALYAAKNKYDLDVRITGQFRNLKKARDIYGDLFSCVNFSEDVKGSFDYIIHTAAPTASKFFIEHPVETIKASVESTMDVLESARINKSSVVYLSSMEQYGIPYEPGQTMTEDKIGIIDHLNIRSSYSESKRLCECLCASYASEYGINVKIARLAQTFGAGIPLTDNRMPMQFAKSVVELKDIVLHTEGKSLNNFVYITDAIVGILTILKNGEVGEAYNICNDRETRSVIDVARLVGNKVANNKIGVRTEIMENMGYAPDVSMYLDSSKLRHLGWTAEIDMTEAYNRLVTYLKEVIV